jgi:hypothetical protein
MTSPRLGSPLLVGAVIVVATRCERTARSSAPLLARAGGTPSGDVIAALSHTARRLATGAAF